jgi:hypothetical protein
VVDVKQHIEEYIASFIRVEVLAGVTKLTPWSRVLPEKLKCPKLLKEFPAFYGIRRFITVYTRARNLSLS